MFQVSNLWGSVLNYFPHHRRAWSTGADTIVSPICWQITYGSVIKLMHERTKFRLHSHDVPYGSGSGQQSVTSFPNVDDANSYWVRVSPVYFFKSI